MLEPEPSRDYNLPIDGGGASVKSPSLKKGRCTSAVSTNVVPVWARHSPGSLSVSSQP